MDKNRFRSLWDRCANGHAAEADAAGVFARLEQHYRESHRFYHTTNHINYCLASMDSASDTLGRSDEVELAIWFHDVIYYPGEADNEQRSADWFADLAGGCLATDTVTNVTRYIMSTTHADLPDDFGSRFVVDVDLSGFGLPEEDFIRDGENIRREFPHLTETEFSQGQGAFLKKLLDRGSIYSTPYFYQRFEQQARQNIRHALERYGV